MCRGSRLLVVLAAAGSLWTTGCSTMDNTEKGVGLGGLLGAGAGTAIGAATGNPKTGAVVGGLLGAGVGGAIGADADREERKEVRQAQAAAAAAAAPQQLGMMDVVKMCQQSVDPNVIINQIRNSGSTFNLSNGDIEYLTQCNVPPQVIAAMQAARPGMVVGAPPPTVVVTRPPPAVIVASGYYYGYRRPYWY
jgi:surface antigen